MSNATYELWLTNDHGVRMMPLDNVIRMTASRQVNRIGHISIDLPAVQFQLKLNRDEMIQVWRQPAGGRLGLWRVYFVRGMYRGMSGSREIVNLRGPDCNDLLRRRIVAHYAGESESEYSSEYADDMMKDIVTNATTDGTNPSPTAGARTWSDFSVAVDVSAGPQINKSCAWKQLLTTAGGGVLADINEASRTAGTEVYFDVVPDSVSATSITFQFRTYTGQPGLDVSDRVVFSQEDKNLKDPFMDYDFEDEVNYIYAGGQGEEDEREIQQVYEDDPWMGYNASQWNRCEGFADARNQETANGVREAGRAALAEGRPRITAGGVPVDTAGTRFGLHWNHGDRVKMRYSQHEYTCLIRSTVLKLDDKGQETIDARLEYAS